MAADKSKGIWLIVLLLIVAGLLAAPEASLRATKAVLRAALSADGAVDQRRNEREAQIPLLRRLAASL